MKNLVLNTIYLAVLLGSILTLRYTDDAALRILSLLALTIIIFMMVIRAIKIWRNRTVVADLIKEKQNARPQEELTQAVKQYRKNLLTRNMQQIDIQYRPYRGKKQYEGKGICTIEAPSFKRARALYLALPEEQQKEGGYFRYDIKKGSKQLLHKV